MKHFSFTKLYLCTDFLIFFKLTICWYTESVDCISSLLGKFQPFSLHILPHSVSFTFWGVPKRKGQRHLCHPSPVCRTHLPSGLLWKTLDSSSKTPIKHVIHLLELLCHWFSMTVLMFLFFHVKFWKVSSHLSFSLLILVSTPFLDPSIFSF